MNRASAGPLDPAGCPPRPQERPISRAALTIVLLVLLGGIPYVASLGAPFAFDDIPQLVENPLIRDLGFFLHPSRVDASGATGDQLSCYRNRWVAVLSFALNYRVHGLSVAGFHLVNLLIHLSAGLLLYRLVRRTALLSGFDGSRLRGREAEIGFFSACLFLMHPIQTQAVTYIVQRMASLAAMLCLLSITAWLEARTRSRGATRWGFYALSLAALLAAMKTKENSATFPLILLLYEIIFFTGPLRRRLLALGPHLATSLVVPVSILGTAAPAAGLLDAVASTRAASPDLGRAEYLFTQFRVIVAYLRLLVWPAGQNLDPDVRISRSLAEPAVLGALALLMTLAGLAIFLLWRSRKGDAGLRLIGFGILWFFVALAVESSVVPIQDVMFEHRVYLPSAGLFTAAVAAVFFLAPRQADRRVVAVLALASIALAAATFLRNRVWDDSLSLWRDTVEKSPGKARPHFTYADYLRKSGDLPGARRELEAALDLDPRNTEILNNLGGLALMGGDIEHARSYYQHAVETQPRNAEAQFNLATVCERLGRWQEALEHYERFVSLNPPGLEEVVVRTRERIAWLNQREFGAPAGPISAGPR